MVHRPTATQELIVYLAHPREHNGFYVFTKGQLLVSARLHTAIEKVTSHRNRKNGFDTNMCDCACDALRHRNHFCFRNRCT